MIHVLQSELPYKKNGKVFVRSGAGIVADSVFLKMNIQECINKAKASLAMQLKFHRKRRCYDDSY